MQVGVAKYVNSVSKPGLQTGMHRAYRSSYRSSCVNVTTIGMTTGLQTGRHTDRHVLTPLKNTRRWLIVILLVISVPKIFVNR